METFCCDRCFQRFPLNEGVNEPIVCLECSEKPKLIRDKLMETYSFRGHPVEVWSLKEETA